MNLSLTSAATKAAIATLDAETSTLAEKVEMLIKMAHNCHANPKTPKHLEDAVHLYCEALERCEQVSLPLLEARALMGLGTALRSIPVDEQALLVEARMAYEQALPLLRIHASQEETAEAEMHLGGVLQALAPSGQASLAAAIAAYQQALQVFTSQTHPKEYAILQNNLAIAYLAMPVDDSAGEPPQLLAMQALEQALQHVSLVDYPNEYAMLYNNLGNALQYMPGIEGEHNHRRAIAAYDEALKVRTPTDTPLEYAHTLANKAHALLSLPDDDDRPEAGNPRHLLAARALYEEAREIFREYGQDRQADTVSQALSDIAMTLTSAFTAYQQGAPQAHTLQNISNFENSG